MLFINPDECIDCAACEPVCPVAAIFAEDSVPQADQEFIPLNALYFQNREEARRRVEHLAKAKGKVRT